MTTLADALTLRPGDRAALTVRLANGTHGEIRGEAQLAAPWGGRGSCSPRPSGGSRWPPEGPVT
ncbi:hypothetical protein ACFSTC_50750 [Nonomuraea ferruginea]